MNSNRRTWARAVAATLAVIAGVACVGDRTNPDIATGPNFGFGPTLESYVGPGDGFASAIEIIGTATQGLPEWQGENPATAPPGGPPFECPPAWTTIADHYINGYHFIVHGYYIKVTDLPPVGAGLPQARYWIPTGNEGECSFPDCQAKLMGGTGDAYCKVWRVFSGQWAIWVGRLQFHKYNVTMEVYPGGDVPADEAGGWIFDGDNWQNGDGGDWQAALQHYLDTGQCPVGWDIWVDGAAVCFDGSPA